jgi:hypothetical protein
VKVLKGVITSCSSQSFWYLPHIGEIVYLKEHATQNDYYRKITVKDNAIFESVNAIKKSDVTIRGEVEIKVESKIVEVPIELVDKYLVICQNTRTGEITVSTYYYRTQEEFEQRNDSKYFKFLGIIEASKKQIHISQEYVSQENMLKGK